MNNSMSFLHGQSLWIGDDLRHELSAVAGFRNILVHGYAEVDGAIVRDVLEHWLHDLLQYAASIRARLSPAQEYLALVPTPSGVRSAF